MPGDCNEPPRPCSPFPWLLDQVGNESGAGRIRGSSSVPPVPGPKVTIALFDTGDVSASTKVRPQQELWPRRNSQRFCDAI